jgi:hypothetical protein
MYLPADGGEGVTAFDAKVVDDVLIRNVGSYKSNAASSYA